MREYSTTILIAAVITFLVTPIVRKFASKSGAVMKIRARDIHALPTPRWGGLAFAIFVHELQKLDVSMALREGCFLSTGY